MQCNLCKKELSLKAGWGPNRKYCNPCSKLAKKKNDNERMRKKRLENKINHRLSNCETYQDMIEALKTIISEQSERNLQFYSIDELKYDLSESGINTHDLEEREYQIKKIVKSEMNHLVEQMNKKIFERLISQEDEINKLKERFN